MNNTMNYSCSYEAYLSEHLDRTLNPDLERELVGHLKDCSICQSTLAEMDQLNTILLGYERAVPTPEQMAGYRKSLRNIAKPASESGFRKVVNRVADMLDSILNPRPVGWKIAQVAAILAIGIIIGNQFIGEDGTSPAPVREPSIVVLSVTPDDIQFMNNYLNKSEIFLLAMANSQDEVSRASGDITFSRNVAQTLLRQTQDMEQRASKLDNNELSVYLNRLEQVLLEVANMDIESGVYTLSELKSAIAEKQLIMESQRFQNVMASIEQRTI
jgi:hypothetical protein